MNKLFKPLFTLSVLIAVSATSCKRVCDLGYEGKHCPTEIRTKYLGERIVGSGTCDSGSGNETDTINILGPVEDVTKVRFQYLDGAVRSINGETRPDGTLVIPENTQFGNAYTISGNATIENGKIKITYTIKRTDNSIPPRTCVWTQE